MLRVDCRVGGPRQSGREHAAALSFLEGGSAGSADARVILMGSLLRDVPALVWIGAAFAVLAVWAHDVRGLYIAGICVVLGTIQAGTSK